jgi:DNA polymerase alpha subunit A
VIKTEEDESFMANLLGEMSANIPTPQPRATKKRKSSPGPPGRRAVSPSRAAKAPASKKLRFSDEVSPPTPQSDPAYPDDDEGYVPVQNDDILPQSDAPMSDPMPSSPAANAASRKSQGKAKAGGDNEEAEDDDMMEVAHAGAVNAASVNMSGSRVLKKIVKPEPYPSPANSSPARAAETAVDASSWNDITEKLNVVSSSPDTRAMGKIDYKDALEEDGSLNMFWTDYTEVNGSLCLFGKVLNKKTRQYVSCFVKIDNILRKLYFLPRNTRVAGGVDTGEDVGMMDVYTEVDALMTKMNVGMYKIKACTRKYAFELPDVPKEGQYMKLFYPYTKPAIEPSTTGEMFSHVFGSNTALFEQFVMWKNIMGPCWLKIKDADFDAIKNASHCKLEVLLDHPNMIAPLSDGDNLEAPPLTLMSVAMRMTFNAKENKQEILAMSARIYESVSLSDTTPADKLPCRTFTLVRPNGTAFPIGFEQQIKSRKTRGLVKTMKQESEMLSFFLAQLDVVDPDVLIGHQLEGVDYSILLNRLHEKKIHQWSRLGRLRRSQGQWPSSIGKTGGNVFAERQLIAGRLLCDLANDAGKSTMFKCQSWSLTEMCSLYLPGSDKRREIDNEAALKTWAATKDGFMDYVTHLEADTYFIAALALRVQILPLTKILTNIAGNSWARTLTGTRAERNEYILLHEFHRNKYICPDKQTFRGRQKEEEKEENDDADGGASKKKDKYKGGLVFEPQKGLFDKFVLVMDFNSLYPSIIQEFNICFTTVNRTATQVSIRTDRHIKEEITNKFCRPRTKRRLYQMCPPTKTRASSQD